MRITFLSLPTAFALILSFACVVSAGPLEDGRAAYNSGDYATALQHWRPLAKQGAANTENKFGIKYAEGFGVEQDHSEAVKWYRLAAVQGYAKAQTDLYPIYAWGLFGLVVAIIIGLLKNRRASVEVGILIAALVAAHVLRVMSLIASGFDDYLLGLFAFIPSRYTLGSIYDWGYGGLLADLWSPFTYMFLHSDGSHLFFNCVALFVFGRAVAWRIGAGRFLLLFAASGASGALVHLLFNWGQPNPLIGASASFFGIMAATVRFVPRTEHRLRALLWPDEKLRAVPLASPAEIFMERRSLVFLTICLIIYPLGLTALILGTLGNVALGAHVGGFALGLFAFGLFDRPLPEISQGAPAGAEDVTSE